MDGLNEFVSKSRIYIDKYLYSDFDDVDEKPNKRSPYRNASLLVGLNTSKPYFVEECEKAIERKKKGPISIFLHKIYENYIRVLLILAFVSFFLLLIGMGLWDLGRGMLGSMGLIEYKTQSEKSYEQFLASVSNCGLIDTVSSSEKDKWPIYATYNCPDGSKKTWKKHVKVITELGDKIIVD